MSKTSEYTTTSLSLAAALQIVSHAKVENIVFPINTTRGKFVFDKDKDPNFELIIEKFWAKELGVDAFSYFEAIKYLKSRLYEERTG